MDSPTDKKSEATAGLEPAAAEQLADPGRRRFSRGALSGSAVLLSLGNRSAWGQTVGCMSVATVNSFDPTTGMFISAPVERPTRNEDLAAEIHRLGDAPDYLGSDGTYTTCPNPESLDSVCVVKGDCPL